MARKLNFDDDNSAKLVNKVIKKVEEDMDNKKRDIEIDLIDMNDDNESVFGLDDIDYLAENIKEDGFSGAIEVYALDNGRYEISSGHRRYLAAKQLGMKTIPAIVSENVDDITKAKKHIKSNILNRKMTPLKWAKALNYYKDVVLENYEGVRSEELGRIFQLSEKSVRRYLSLLKLIPELQKYVDVEAAPYTNIIPLTKLSPEDQLKALSELKILYPNVDNVFLSASGLTINQIVNKLSASNNVTNENTPSAEQVKNRVAYEREEEEEDEDDGRVIVAPSVPGNRVSFEEKILDKANASEEDKAFERDIREARLIDNQMQVYATNMKALVSKKHILTPAIKEQLVEQLNEILEILKNE